MRNVQTLDLMKYEETVEGSKKTNRDDNSR